MTDPSRGLGAEAVERAKQVFRFLKAFSERNLPIKRTLGEQQWTLVLRELPEHPSIKVGSVEVRHESTDVVEAGQTQAEPLIRVTRPTLTPAPGPPRALLDWVLDGWQQPDGQVRVAPSRNVPREDGQVITELFDDDPTHDETLADWERVWRRWADAERPARAAMKAFERLYGLHGRIELESERVELILGDGHLRWLTSEGLIDHPILLQRVELEFDAAVPEFRVVDSDRSAELYAGVLHTGEGIQGEKLKELQRELELGGYHPLAGDGTAGYLRRLAALLAPGGEFVASRPTGPANERPVIGREPALFLRLRPSGLPAAFDRVLQDLENQAVLPLSLMRVVGVEPPITPEPAVGVFAPWSEPLDVLLSKPANLEQIQIARALEQHKAVIVQGPPGTGKSHTIANLIGHLVAHGKRVLVTSHTTKALRVLRDQIVEPLRPLCVAVLENDLDGRAQMEQAVRGIVTRLTTATRERLATEVDQFARTRLRLIAEIDLLTQRLREVREAEYLPIVVGGDSVGPSQAAQEVEASRARHEWLPGPVAPGAPMPLSEREIVELYETNETLTPSEEVELAADLPPVNLLPPEPEFAALVRVVSVEGAPPHGAHWTQQLSATSLESLSALANRLDALDAELHSLEDWQRAIVGAGHAGGAEREIWEALRAQVVAATERWDKARDLLLNYETDVAPSISPSEARDIADQIRQFLQGGGALGRMSLMLKPSWRALIKGCRVNGEAPSKVVHFTAIAATLGLAESRAKVAQRWNRQAVPIGLPAVGDLPGPVEPVLMSYVGQFAVLLSMWNDRWQPIATSLSEVALNWQAFRDQEVARAAPATPFEGHVATMAGPLRLAVAARLAATRRLGAQEYMAKLASQLASYAGPICSALRKAVIACDEGMYEVARQDFDRLARKAIVLRRRRELVKRLEVAAPGWAGAIGRRTNVHGSRVIPGDALPAWRWRQLAQELDQRATLDEVALTRDLEARRSELREATAQLIDRKAWLEQVRRTGLEARQALIGWSDTQRKIGKGTGKRVPELQAQARLLLSNAREAVPVWIMPLNRVAESFDPTRGKFDVVIIDEASQSDVTGLLAWYLGKQVAVVGDHEQVSPLAVGQTIDGARALITEHLGGIPNAHLYDGQTSIYDLARQSFGGAIGLREHFRCVPDIIDFSNHLSYNGEIRPLRDPGTARLPHAIEYVVPAELGMMRSDKTNLAEARVIAALVKAATEQAEYAGKTMGAITLLGDDQAATIQDLARELIGAVELERRRFVSGNAAQFQGDERNIIWLSMVDVPGNGPLMMKATPALKQRYNVAASRARDQLWLVHSLDPARDLKAGDLRRRLIEHMRDPAAPRRALGQALARAESPFEEEVIRRLVAAGFHVRPQVEVGHFRIDLVVTDGTRQAAIECDGDRFHPFEQIVDDMSRQAVLERAGWRFVRIRGTRFFRDPEATMRLVLEQLRRLEVEPIGADISGDRDREGEELKDRVIRRAWEIMRERDWVPAAQTNGGGDEELANA